MHARSKRAGAGAACDTRELNRLFSSTIVPAGGTSAANFRNEKFGTFSL
jgi:hypothetical protein